MQRNTIRRNAEEHLIPHLPEIFETLREASLRFDLPKIVVLCHDDETADPYQFRTCDGQRWTPPPAARLVPYALLRPFRFVYERQAHKQRVPGNLFVAFDLENGHLWFSRQFKSLARIEPEHRLDAVTLKQASFEPVDTPPSINFRSQTIGPEHLRGVRQMVGSPGDVPEEVFLIEEDLLRLAADSLVEAERLDPRPVHLNALWVFSKPVRLMRSNGHERHITAVWFRQGAAVWRSRAYVGNMRGGRRPPLRMSGEQLSGRTPFVPYWDAGHPEQKFLAAVWALMQQEDFTETQPLAAIAPGAVPRPALTSDGMHVVQLRTGSEHARMYRGQDQGLIARSTWSVRGHWRRQPYPSLGVDENGHAVTKLIWIASYIKGDGTAPPADSKLISVH